MFDWEILEAVDPWGQRRDDWRFALLAATVMNAAGLRKVDGRIFNEQDFLIDFLPRLVPLLPPTRQWQSQKAIEAEILAWVNSSNVMFNELRKGKAS